MSNPVTEKLIKQAKEYDDFVQMAKKAKKAHGLHSPVEKRLASLLSRLYSNDCIVPEVSAVPGGRNDLMQFSFSGRRAVFELFFSPSQVPQDLRLLELADADVKVAILLDQEINSKLAEEYFRKKPNHFPYLWLSDLMLLGQEEICLMKLCELVDEDFPTNLLHRILSLAEGKKFELSIRRFLKRIEAEVTNGKAEGNKHQKLTGGEYIVLQIINKISKLGIPTNRLRSLDTWLQENIPYAIMLVDCGLQVFLKTDLMGHYTTLAAGDFADDLIVGKENNDRAYLVICLNKIINDFLDANGHGRKPLQFHFYHTSQEQIFEMFSTRELGKTNTESEMGREQLKPLGQSNQDS